MADIGIVLLRREEFPLASEVRVKLLEGTVGVASARSHAIVVDRSPELGGADLGFTGGEVLFASIGTCLLTTLVGAARNKKIEMTKIEFTITGESASNPSRFASIDVQAVVEGNASDEELAELLELAEKRCTVSNTIAVGAPINVSRIA